jgi:hypothetical protein
VEWIQKAILAHAITKEEAAVPDADIDRAKEVQKLIPIARRMKMAKTDDALKIMERLTQDDPELREM